MTNVCTTEPPAVMLSSVTENKHINTPLTVCLLKMNGSAFMQLR